MKSSQVSVPRKDAPAASRSTAACAADLVALRAGMLRFARRGMRNPDLAEDLVQDAIESALRNLSCFVGTSSLKTWVYAILRHRMVDHLRTVNRSVNFTSLGTVDMHPDQLLEALHDSRADCEESPAAWPSPESVLESRQFLGTLGTCVESLPPQAGKVFAMREILGFHASEVSSQLGITATNCNVILHRAKAKIRGCMGAASIS